MHNVLSETFEALNNRSNEFPLSKTSLINDCTAYQSDKEIAFHMLFNNLGEFISELKREKSKEYANAMILEQVSLLILHSTVNCF